MSRRRDAGGLGRWRAERQGGRCRRAARVELLALHGGACGDGAQRSRRISSATRGRRRACSAGSRRWRRPRPPSPSGLWCRIGRSRRSNQRRRPGSRQRSAGTGTRNSDPGTATRTPNARTRNPEPGTRAPGTLNRGLNSAPGARRREAVLPRQPCRCATNCRARERAPQATGAAADIAAPRRRRRRASALAAPPRTRGTGAAPLPQMPRGEATAATAQRSAFISAAMSRAESVSPSNPLIRWRIVAPGVDRALRQTAARRGRGQPSPGTQPRRRPGRRRRSSPWPQPLTAPSSTPPTAASPGRACKKIPQLRSKNSGAEPRYSKERFNGSRLVLVALICCRAVVGFSGGRNPADRTRSRPRPPKGSTTPRRSGRAQRHRLQLRHRARARRAQSRAPERHVRPELHGHRRDRESGDRPFPVAQRAVARQRAGAELRIRSARAREAAAQVRRPRRDARAHASGERHDRGRRSHRAPAQLQQSAGVAHQRRDRDRPARRPHSVSRAAGHALHAADVDLDARQRRRPRVTASRLRISPASCRGTPTTCSPWRATTRPATSTDG